MLEILHRFLCCSLVAVFATACASPGASEADKLPNTIPSAELPAELPADLPADTPTERPAADNNRVPTLSPPVTVSSPTRQGQLQFDELTEVSGLAASQRRDGVLWAINDSDNDAALYAFDEAGQHLGKWPVAAGNRDWEDLASVWYNGDAYLLIAETGDNLRLYSEYKIHVMQEPLLDGSQDTLYPLTTLSFRYSDGKHNVEAIGVLDDSIILISKEPLNGSTHSPGRVYRLPFELQTNTRLLEASYLTTLARQDVSVETRLAAALTGVSLNNVTALDFDSVNRIAYLLTYRQVIQLPLSNNDGELQNPDNSLEALSVGLSQRGNILYRHDLHQAEAMTVDRRGQIWLTSENAQAPLWVLPAP